MPFSCLRTWPLILFGVIEPVLLVWAYILGTLDPYDFYASQVPNLKSDFPPQAESMTLQNLNMLLLLAAIAIICCWTTNSRVVRWYLIAVAMADLGHVYATYRGVGEVYFWDWRGWNGVVAGNVGVSLFLHVNRVATVGGVFGRFG